ncbi:MAG: hypothetical protein CL678_12795 [Bdellovibrionaceae bacterium]|nr:hypothetical protein [Pseudobdellovibrionaceae bacterium]|tara:strand:+ start:6123 stop:6521 length:399 start_codon:yes stop_codon:yes gene_type:complete
MSRDDIKRKREREDELEAEIKRNRPQNDFKSAYSQAQKIKEDSKGGLEKFMELLERAEPLLEKVNSLYLQYFGGIEKFPPRIQKEQLDQIMKTLTLMNKATPSMKFRFDNIQSQYLSYQRRWEKKLKEMQKR